MKKIILGLTLLSSLSVFSSEDCVSDKTLDRKATMVKVLASIGLADKQCEELTEMIKGSLCQDVEQGTINYAEEVIEYMCD